jgi:hypothetical protein
VFIQVPGQRAAQWSAVRGQSTCSVQ